MNLIARLVALEQTRRTEADAFVRRMDARVARAVPSLDVAAVQAAIERWCEADPELEARWMAACITLGLLDAAGGLIPGSPPAKLWEEYRQ